MVFEQKDMKIPYSLIQYCPICKQPMTMNLRIDYRFVEDDGFHKANKRYDNFIKTYIMKKIVFFELGVSYNTPLIIKYLFMKMTIQIKREIDFLKHLTYLLIILYNA